MYRQRRDKRSSSSSSQLDTDSPSTSRRIKLRILLNDPSPSTGENEDRTRRVELFNSHGYIRVSATDASRALAFDMVVVDRGVPNSKGVDAISGNVRQYDLTHGAKKERFAPLVERWNVLVKEVAASAGIRVDELHVVDPKLLVSKPKDGHQPVHFDCDRVPESHHKYAAILYCSSGTYSTALPKFPSNPLLSFSLDPIQMQAVAGLLKPEHYESLPVFAGDIVFFRQSTPHFGVQNVAARDNRIVLFSILSSSSHPRQDGEQVLPWLFIGIAFTWHSREFAQALVDYRQFKPLDQIEEDFGKDDEQVCIDCLTRFGLLEAYYS